MPPERFFLKNCANVPRQSHMCASIVMSWVWFTRFISLRALPRWWKVGEEWKVLCAYATHFSDGIRLFNIYWFYEQLKSLRESFSRAFFSADTAGTFFPLALMLQCHCEKHIEKFLNFPPPESFIPFMTQLNKAFSAPSERKKIIKFEWKDSR